MFTIKRSLFFPALTVILSLEFAACGSSHPSDTSDREQTTTSGTDSNKSITIVIAEAPPSFNSGAADTGYDALVKKLVILDLTDIDPNGNIFPELAADLPTIDNGDASVDEEVVTMSAVWKVRSDVQWHDGTPVNADEIVSTRDV